MAEKFVEVLAEGGKTNSLGRAAEVIEAVLHDKSRLEELYGCLFADDAWVRMRAADSLEKVCREHPDWLLPYVDRFAKELSASTQPSIQWHLAQMYAQLPLTPAQKELATTWLKQLLSTKDVDWIVSANAMDTLMQFTHEGSFSPEDMLALLRVQQHHKSNAVTKRAAKHLAQIEK